MKQFGQAVEGLLPRDRMVSLSCRGMEAPSYRITRSDLWEDDVNPWTESHKLPTLQGGKLGELLYRGEPCVINDFTCDADDPAARYFEGMRSLLVMPVWDNDRVLNMVVLMRSESDAYDTGLLADAVWISNIFGRATKNLVVRNERDAAYKRLDEELKWSRTFRCRCSPVKFRRCRILISRRTMSHRSMPAVTTTTSFPCRAETGDC